jgi:bleomycin hydrolase
MGANQSKTPLVNEKLVIERLRALEIEGEGDSEYVHVSEKSDSYKYRAPWTSLSVSEVGHWERQLLQDPKNR